MASEYVADAHALVWYLEANVKLGSAANAALADLTCVIHLPVIALADACWVVEKKRSTIPNVISLLQDIDRDKRIVVIPLERRIIDISVSLTSISEMHDRMIAATLIALQADGIPVSLLTRDPNIISSGIGPIVW